MITLQNLDQAKVAATLALAKENDDKAAANATFNWKQGTYTIIGFEETDGKYTGVYLSYNGAEAQLCQFAFAVPFFFTLDGETFDQRIDCLVNGIVANQVNMQTNLMSKTTITVVEDKPCLRFASRKLDKEPKGESFQCKDGKYMKVKDAKSFNFTFA